MFQNIKCHFGRCARPLQALLLFICLQVVFAFVTGMVCDLLFLSPVLSLIFTSLLSGILTMGCLMLWHYVERTDWRSTQPNHILLLFVVLQMVFAVAMNIAVELCEIPDMLTNQFIAIMSQPLGILAVAVVAPVTEEMVFRGALLGGMLRQGYSARTAIVVSAFLFGLIHGNPVQIVFASFLGVLLGWTYWRTRSLWPAVCMHVANNTSSVLMMHLSDDPAGRITDQLSLGVSLALMIVSLLCTYLLCRFLDKRCQN